MNSLHMMLDLLFTFFLFCAFAQEQTNKRVILTFRVYADIEVISFSKKENVSAMHCMHLCINDANCSAIFKPHNASQKLKGPCLMYSSLTEKDIRKDQQQNDTFKGLAYIIKKPWNCREANELSIPRKSGVYDLEGIGRHYCKMDMKNCSAGGWTLALKVDGNKNTFNYSSSFWSTVKTHNEDKCLANITSNEEGKFQAFGSLPFEKICLEMKVGSDIRGVEIPIRGKSLQQLFEADQYIPTHLGRTAWKTLVGGSSLQIYCNQEGTNMRTNTYLLRLGILSNDFNNCIETDSFIGIGLLPIMENLPCVITHGNCAYWNTDNGDKSTGGISYLYIL